MNDLLSLDMMSTQNMLFMLPEMIVTFGILVVLGLTLLTSKKSPEENGAIMGAALVFVLGALGALVWNYVQAPPTVPQSVMFETLTSDRLAYLIRGIVLLGAGLSIGMAHRYLERATRVIGDYYALIMGATLGGMFLASASDLITVFVGLETLSITSFILAGYLRKTVKSTEASFKYLIYGSMGTAVFLFGLSIVYGLVGSTNFSEIAAALTNFQGMAHPTLVVMLLMVVAALGYKLSTAPFHMWTPDVYEGAPTPVSAFLSVVSKSAAFAATLRFMVVLFGGFALLPTLWVILAVLSMTIGNFVALKQQNVKRLLAYSTIAHAGYMLLGLAVGTADSLGGILFYLVTYLFMNLGAFAAAITFHNLTGSDEVDAYRGLVYKQPMLAFGFTVCLLSLAGIPITSGFFAKFVLFQSVVVSHPEYLWLIIVALLNSTVSLAYYIRIIRLMVVKEPSPQVMAIPLSPVPSGSLSTALAVSVTVTLLLGIFASPFLSFSMASAQQLVAQRLMLVSQAQAEKQ